MRLYCDDSLVRQYEAKGEYTTGSLYSIINFRGVQPVYIPAVCFIKIPPRVQVFLWLLSHNKLMTKDNLAKRGIEKPLIVSTVQTNKPFITFSLGVWWPNKSGGRSQLCSPLT